MKRFLRVLLPLSLVLILSVTAFAAGSGKFYRDERTGLRFEVPKGWTLEVTTDEAADAVLTLDENPMVLLVYASVDTYEETRIAYEQDGKTMPYKTRAEYDRGTFNQKSAAETFGCSKDQVHFVTYGGNDYYYVEKTVLLTYDIEYPAVYFMRIENGYLYIFQFYGGSENEHFKDVEELLGTAEYPGSGSADENSFRMDLSLRNLLLSLLITIVIYSLPIFVYRWCIRKYPMDRKPAKIITIVYAIVAFIVMSVIIFTMNGAKSAGTAVLLWSFVNYKVLTGGKDTRRRLSKKAWTEFVVEQDGGIVQTEPVQSEEKTES